MSWEAEWQIERMPSLEELERHMSALVEIAQLTSTVVSVDDYGGFAISVVLRAARAEDIPTLLGFDYRDREDVRRDLDPPEGEHYNVTLDVVAPDNENNEPRPFVRIYSNDGDNRDAWPVVHDIGLALAMRLGMIDEDDQAEPPKRELSEDELN